MARFIYTAKAQPKENIEGYIDAESEQDAINKITKLGYFPVSVKPEITSFDKKSIFTLKKISQKDIVLFTRQLASLIEAGVNLINSLNIIYRQTANKYLKIVLNEVISQLKDGKPFSESLALHPEVFPSLYCAMIKTGESSGNLKITLNRLSEFLEREEDFKNSMLAALTYPFFVLLVGFLTVVVLLIFVIPGLINMFKDMGQVLPLPTRILIGISEFLRSYGWFLLIAIAIFLFALYRANRRPAGRLFMDRLKLKMGLFGQIILKTEISRLMRSLALLISSGMPITAALEISVAILDNRILFSETEKFKEMIKNGSSFTSALEKLKIFPDFVRSITVIGEETGALDKSLNSIANEYELEVDRILKAFARLLEPVIILGIGLVVGFIVIAMLLPIFEINFLVK